VEALITDDYLAVEARIAELQPELVLGTQMERHIAKRLRVACAVISAPVHVQDFPARYAPQMGFEGANVIFDTWVHPLMMGLEEHLIGMFRGDFEFADHATPSHLGAGHGSHQAQTKAPESASSSPAEPVLAPAQSASVSTLLDTSPEQSAPPAPVADMGGPVRWASEAELELKKIPFFVRGKARRNTERFAAERGVGLITVDTLYDAKAHFGR
jgi:light-independent protochlorophyllide reductase subunit B